jgi:hypothetical protein
MATVMKTTPKSVPFACVNLRKVKMSVVYLACICFMSLALTNGLPLLNSVHFVVLILKPKWNRKSKDKGILVAGARLQLLLKELLSVYLQTQPKWRPELQQAELNFCT